MEGPEPNAGTAALYAHYYDGGLRIEHLGGGAPAWAPANVEGFAGLRNELALAPGDYVVEFSRRHHGPADLTWIAVYQPAVDAYHGDRKNYSGVGVWLLDQTVTSPLNLLAGLRGLTTTLIEAGLEPCRRAAEGFLQSRHLPSYVRPLTPMPPGLAGWTFAGGLLPRTARLFVDEPTETGRWEAVAEQLNRMALLPGPSAEHARALILVPGPHASAPPADAARVERTLAADLAARLPDAVADMARASSEARDQRDAREADIATLRGQLASAEQMAADARARIAELEAQVAESDLLRRLGSIDQALKRVENGIQRTEDGVRTLRRGRSEADGGTRRDPWLGLGDEGRRPDAWPTANIVESQRDKPRHDVRQAAKQDAPIPTTEWWIVPVVAGLVITLVAMVCLVWWIRAH